MRQWPLWLTGGWTFWTPRYCSDHSCDHASHPLIRGKRSACLQNSSKALLLIQIRT